VCADCGLLIAVRPQNSPRLTKLCVTIFPTAGRRISKREQVGINESQNNNKERGEEQGQR